MPQLLLEFFSEEIPARMQKRAEEDLARLFNEATKGAHFGDLAIHTFSTPRRIGLVVDNLPIEAVATHQTRKGPRVGAPQQAIEGFLKSTGLSSIDQAAIEGEVGKEFYVARTTRPALPTIGMLQSIIPEIIRAFPWPKSMRSGSGDLQWVRPLQNILCLFGGAPVKISIDGVPSEANTWGHRFHAPEIIRPKDFADYAAKLRAAKVEIDREARKATILESARRLCAEKKLEMVEDVGLLEEVAGLVEWPVVLLGDMDPASLDLPGEVVRLSMRTHQKYFAVRDPKTGKLAPHFIVVANMEAKDGGKAIAAGNARVLSARLNDARFFWDTDRKTPLYTDARREKLKKIVFHQKLGSVWDKVERVKALAVELCSVTGADVELVKRAAELCKMDLVTETVGEFPELQGQIGRQLYLAELSTHLPLDGGGGRAAAGGGARATLKGEPPEASPSPSWASPPQSSLRADSSPIEGERESIAAANEDHYRPLGPGDRVPSDPVAVTLALADKLDALAGFWAIDEKPTGSSDPYALRRAALGVIRLILASDLRVAVVDIVETHLPRVLADIARVALEAKKAAAKVAGVSAIISQGMGVAKRRWPNERSPRLVSFEAIELLSFFADRLKVQLRDQGKRHDLVDAVFALGDDDLVRIVARVEALDAFLKTEDGANLLAGYKRAANILAAEAKKGKWSAEEGQGEVDLAKLVEPAERALSVALAKALPAAQVAVGREEFAAAMSALSGLRGPVDAFFERVLVNAEDAALRRNRLLLLSRLREALSAVADFSKIEG